MAAKSPILMYARRILQDAIDRIDNGDDSCSDEAVAHFLEQVNAESKGYYTESSFVNYDEAMRILGIGNRVKLKSLLDKNHIKMNKINNFRVGFLRSEVEALAIKRRRQP